MTIPTVPDVYVKCPGFVLTVGVVEHDVQLPELKCNDVKQAHQEKKTKKLAFFFWAQEIFQPMRKENCPFACIFLRQLLALWPKCDVCAVNNTGLNWFHLSTQTACKTKVKGSEL